LKVALLGLLQSGKSTILSAVSGKAIPPPGSTAIEEAIVPVPDERLDWLREYCKPKKPPTPQSIVLTCRALTLPMSTADLRPSCCQTPD